MYVLGIYFFCFLLSHVAKGLSIVGFWDNSSVNEILIKLVVTQSNRGSRRLTHALMVVCLWPVYRPWSLKLLCFGKTLFQVLLSEGSVGIMSV